jgi:hypothetical protein
VTLRGRQRNFRGISFRGWAWLYFRGGISLGTGGLSFRATLIRPQKESPPIPGARPPWKESHSCPQKYSTLARRKTVMKRKSHSSMKMKSTKNMLSSTQSHAWLRSVHAKLLVVTRGYGLSMQNHPAGKVTGDVKSVCGEKTLNRVIRRWETYAPLSMWTICHINI